MDLGRLLDAERVEQGPEPVDLAVQAGVVGSQRISVGFGAFGASTMIGACFGGGLALCGEQSGMIGAEVGEDPGVVAVHGVHLGSVLSAQLGERVCVVAFEGANAGGCLGFDAIAVGPGLKGLPVGDLGAARGLGRKILRCLGGGRGCNRVGVGFIASLDRGSYLVIGAPQGLASLTNLALGGFSATGGLGDGRLEPSGDGVLVECRGPVSDESGQAADVPSQYGKTLRQACQWRVSQPEAGEQILAGAVHASLVDAGPAAGVLSAGPVPHSLRLPGSRVPAPRPDRLTAPADAQDF